MYLANLTNRFLGQHWQTPPSATPPLTKLAWLCFRASSVFLSPSRPPLVPTHHWVRSSDPQGQRPILSFQDRPWPAFFEEPIFQHLRGLDIPIIFVFVCWVVFTIIRWIISTPVLHTLLLFWHIWAKDEQNKTRTFGDVGNWSRDDCQTCLCSQIKNFPQLPWHLWHFIYIYPDISVTFPNSVRVGLAGNTFFCKSSPTRLNLSNSTLMVRQSSCSDLSSFQKYLRRQITIFARPLSFSHDLRITFDCSKGDNLQVSKRYVEWEEFWMLSLCQICDSSSIFFQ